MKQAGVSRLKSEPAYNSALPLAAPVMQVRRGGYIIRSCSS